MKEIYIPLRKHRKTQRGKESLVIHQTEPTTLMKTEFVFKGPRTAVANNLAKAKSSKKKVPVSYDQVE